MICEKCNGLGYIRLSSISGVTCGNCKGTGKVEQEQTNEDWIKQCNTEQLADWILDVSDECFDCGKSDNGDCPFGKAQGVCTCINKDSVVEWLKQPHKPIS